MAKKTRTELEGFFGAGSIPTAGSFRHLIDSSLNSEDDGIKKSSGTALEIQAGPLVANKRELVLLYESFSSGASKWKLSLETSPKNGLSIFDVNSKGLFIEEGGKVGIGTANPGVELDVLGSINLSGTLTIGGLDVGQAISDLGMKVDGLPGTVTTLGTAISDLDTKISDLDTKVDGLPGTVTTLSTAISDLDTRITNLPEVGSNLKTILDGLADRIATLETHHPPPAPTP